jgi:hypothetical protein
MAYSAPLRFRAPNGGSVFLPPEVGAGIFGLEPDVPEPPPLPEPDPGAYAGTPSIPTPPPDQGLLALPPTLAAPEDPSLVGTATGIARPGLAQLMPQATGPARPEPAPPPRQQPQFTEAGVRAGGLADPANAQRDALQQQRDAEALRLEADGRAARAEGEALAASGARDEAREAERANIQQAALADIAKRSAAIDGEIDRIANTKIDTSSRSPVLAAIGLAMGAIGQALAGRTDGSNPALDIMLKQRDASVQRQMAERDSAVRTVGLRRDQIAGLRQKLGDTNALYDALSVAETRRIRNEIGRVAASSKSDATLAGLAKIDADLATDEAKLKVSLHDKLQAKDERDREFKEQQRTSRDASARGWAGLNQSERHHQDAARRADRQLDVEVAKLMKNGQTDAADRLAELGVGGVTNAKGDTFKAATKDEGKELREQKAAVDTINDFVGQIARGIKDHGGEAAYFKSDAWQRQRSRIAFAKNAIRVGQKMGTLDAGSDKLMDEMAGAVDPTSFWRDASAGLVQMRDNLVTGFNYRLKSQPGYDNHEYKPPDTTSLPGPVVTPEDKRAQSVLAWTPKPQAGGRQAGLIRQDGPSGSQQLKHVRVSVEQWARAAREGKTPDDRAKAQAWLERMRDTAQSPEVREYAREMIEANVISSAPLPRERLPGE